MTSAQALVQPAIDTFSGRFPLYAVYNFLISLHSGGDERSGIVQQILHSVPSLATSRSLSQPNTNRQVMTTMSIRTKQHTLRFYRKFQANKQLTLYYDVA
jgi:hypothetical protein